MPRLNLQPIPRFAFLALGMHALVGAALWWSFHGVSRDPFSSSGHAVTWISPADFQPAKPLPPSSVQLARQDVDPRPMLAVVGVPAPVEPVPKAVAIDPAKALALMHSQQAGSPGTEVRPKAESPPVPPPAAPVAAPASKPAPASADKPGPATDVSRFITVSKCDAGPDGKPASLLDVAALDSGTAPVMEDKSVRFDEVDRAIIDGFRRIWAPPKANTLAIDQRTAHLNVTIDRTGRLLSFKFARRSGNEDFDSSVIDAADRLDKIEVQLPASYPKDHYEFQVHFHVE